MDKAPSEPVPIRLAVVAAADKAPVIITFTLSAGSLNLAYAGEDDLASTIAHLCNDAVEAAAENPTSTIESVVLVARNVLEGAGYQVADLPPHDYEMNIEADQETGRFLARGAPTHSLAPVDGNIQRRILSSLLEKFAQAPHDLATKILNLTQSGDHVGAAQAAVDGQATAPLWANLPAELLSAMLQVEVGNLENDLRVAFQRFRIAVAARAHNYIAQEDDANWLLLNDDTLTPALRIALRTGLANAQAERGHTEAALAAWRDLLKEVTEAGDRGWLWRNIATALKEGNEAIQAARLSADAFLQAGDQRQAGGSYLLESRMLEKVSPAEALEKLDELLEITTQQGLIGSQLRASLHHTKGNRLLALKQGKLALNEAKKSIELRRNVMGAEADLISSLHLAAMAAAQARRPKQADAFAGEATNLENQSNSGYFKVARRIQELGRNYNSALAQEIMDEANALKEPILIAGLKIVTAAQDPALSDVERLSGLEAVINEMTHAGMRERDILPALMALASVLDKRQETARAIPYLERAQRENPLNIDAAQMLISAYQRTQRWAEAASLIKWLISQFGEAPVLLFSYGRCLFEAGSVWDAVAPLTKVIDSPEANPEVRGKASELMNRAVRIASAPPPAAVVVSTSDLQPVTKDEVKTALEEFSKFISLEKRMSFWDKKPGNKDYTWIASPEGYAQDLAHTYLKARFGERVFAVEELGAGAGRIDLYLKFEGGLSVILELKMCGKPYSSTYAAAGEDQIFHYMDQRDCHLGYLLVFDGRLNDFARPLVSDSARQSNTVFELFVDMRSRVSNRKKPANA